MFIPVGHEQDSVRRLPWVTFTIMGLCVAMFLLTLGPISSNRAEVNRLFREIAEYYFTHPDLELDPEIDDVLFQGLPEHQDQRQAFKEFLKEGASGLLKEIGKGKTREETLAEQQAELDRLTARFKEVRQESPYFVFGLVPAHPHLYAYITHQFMHGGWMHLIFNMLFLYLAGPYLEDVWGRPLFAGFYLFSGVFAALIYVMKYPSMEGPLIGASGAIAGLMGAFLIRYGSTKIKFLFFFFMTPRFFDAPAWLMLPLWLLREIFFGQAVDYGGGTGSGVAHWAHVAGFVFGMVVAVGIKQLKIEERFVETAFEARSIQHENPDLEAALGARAAGDAAAADRLLVEHLKKDPGDFDAAMAYWDVRRDLGDVGPALPVIQRAFRDALRRGEHEVVESRWPEVVEMAPAGTIDPVTAARIADTFSTSFSTRLLQETVDAAALSVTDATPSGVVVRLARAGVVAGSNAVAALAQRALASPDLPDETRAELEKLLGEIQKEQKQAPPAEIEEEPVEKPEPAVPSRLAPEDHVLEIIEAVPVAWNAGTLKIAISGRQRSMDLSQVQAIGVGGIVEPGKTPYVLVDLMIDGPWSKRIKLRILRLRSSRFDPCTIVDGSDAMECFRHLLREMVSFSGAVPLPDPDGAVGKPFRRFESVRQYELEVIGLSGEPGN